MFPAAPHRPDRVNDEPGRQTISASNFRLPGLTTAQRSTFREQFGAGRAMNRAINSAAAKKRGIGGVHNAIDIELRDVTADDFDFSHKSQRSRRQPINVP
jgi:hypothetical protein